MFILDIALWVNPHIVLNKPNHCSTFSLLGGGQLMLGLVYNCNICFLRKVLKQKYNKSNRLFVKLLLNFCEGDLSIMQVSNCRPPTQAMRPYSVVQNKGFKHMLNVLETRFEIFMSKKLNVALLNIKLFLYNLEF